MPSYRAAAGSPGSWRVGDGSHRDLVLGSRRNGSHSTGSTAQVERRRDAPGGPNPMNDNDSDAVVEVGDLCSYAVDIWVSDHSILTDRDRLLQALRTAAEQGGAHILGEESHVFPNRAVTAILLLSASHLSIHTWPEYSLANVDLLAYGRIKGELIIRSVEASLSPTRINATRILRAVH
jgi:S-adenosylmethionine decarboxylase